MYSVYLSPNDQPGGRRMISAIQAIVDSRKADSFATSSSDATDIEVEADLVQRLDQLGARKWRDKVSILSLWFPNDGDPLLVKLEILERSEPRIVTGFYPKGDVEYATLVITPRNQEPQRALTKIGKRWVACSISPRSLRTEFTFTRTCSSSVKQPTSPS